VVSGKTLQISVFQKPDASWEETILKFNDTKSLNIYGNLTATGTSSVPVIFTRSGALGTWNGIKFYSGSSGTLSHATIEHATKGVYTHSGANNITVGASTIQNFTEQGIYIYQSSPTVQN